MHRVAIIGAGIGAEHAAAYAVLPERFALSVICDLDRARAHSVAEPYGAAVSASLDDVLADADIDIIDICLPPHLHLPTALAALEAGKAVICEKPLVASLKEADALAQRVAATGRPVFPVFQYRYGTGAAQLRHLIASGLAGRCFAGSLETHWDRPASYYDIPWRGTWTGERGGAVLGHAIHIHDMLCGFLGPVAQVFADLATRVNAIETEDCGALVLTMESGALVTSSITLGAAQNTSRLRLMFEGFTAESDHAPYAPAKAPWTFTARNPQDQAQIDTALRSVPAQAFGFQGLFTAISDALNGRGGAEVTMADGRQSLELVTAIYASARTRAPVLLPIANTHPLYADWSLHALDVAK